MTAPKLAIATPTANRLMLSDYTASLVGMISSLGEAGVATSYHTMDGPYLGLQRDVLADRALADPAVTHLLFIDSDMSFPPDLAGRLLAADKPVIGVIYPRRALDLGRMKGLVEEHGFDRGLALSYEWNVRFPGDRATVRDGLCRVDAIGMGFVLIARSTLAALAASGSAPRYRAPGHPPKTIHGFFRELTEDEALGEDYSFCRRCVTGGQEVWAYPAADVRHVGDFAFGLPFTACLDALRGGAPRPPPES